MQNGISTASVPLPPQNLDAEKSLLGGLIIDREAVNKVVDFLRPEDFYNRNHQVIFDAILRLFEKRENIDLVSLANRLTEMGELEQIGGLGYLTSLATSVPSAAHVATYGRIIQRKKTLRSLIDAAHHIISLGHREEDDIEHLLDEAEQRLFQVSQKSLSQQFSNLVSGLDQAMERVLSTQDGRRRGYTTGHSLLDNTLGGFQKSDLVILAARPSVGKTAFAVDIASRIARLHDIPVGVFSLEMSMDQVVDRFISTESGVSVYKLRNGMLSGTDLHSVTDGISRLKEVKIFIDDASSLNVLQMRAMARRLQAEHGLGLLIIDYLQLMSSRKNYDSPVQQVTEISRGLKGLAKDLNIPIIALSQLSRAIESRGGEPKLSDLRDSGSIEQDADVVMFLHKEGEDKSDPTTAIVAEYDQQPPRPIKLIIAKHRNGPTRNINFQMDLDTLKFYETERRYGQSEAPSPAHESPF